MRRRDFLGALAAAPLLAGFRAHTARADLFLPSSFAATKDGAFDLVVHFHGLLTWQEPAFERAKMRAALASVNLGEGSGHYENAFRSPGALERVIDDVRSAVEKSGVASAKAARVALSGWSAGFGAVGALLAQESAIARVDAVLLEDGLHASYGGDGAPDRSALAKYARFAERAMRGEKLFAITHSAVRAPGYASTTECAAALLAMTGVAKGPPGADALGAHATYCALRGNFRVMGYDGGDVEQHRNHVRRFDETLLPVLRSRWA